MLDRDLRPASRYAVQEPDPVMPRSAASGIAGLVDDATNSLQDSDAISVLTQCILHFSLFQDSVDTPQPVRLCIGHHVEAAECGAEIGQRFAVGPVTLRFFRRQDRVIDGLLGLIAPTEMKRQQFRHFFGTAGVKVLERMSNDPVPTTAVPLEQSAKSSLFRQCMSENIGSVLR